MQINKKYETIFHVALVLFLVLASLSYVGLEQQVYVWDNKGYWDLWKGFSSTLYQNPLKAMEGMLHTLRTYEYNQLFTLPLSPFYLLPIGSRNAFILSVILIYFLPTILLINSILTRLGVVKTAGDKIFVITLVSFFAPFWAPILRGYPDVCGLVFILLSIRLLISTNLTKLDVKSAILLGVYLWLPFALRRWYVYTIISLYFSLPILNYCLFKAKQVDKVKFIDLLKNFTIAGVVTVLLSVLFQYKMLMVILKTSYSEIYSAYNLGIDKSFTIFIQYGGYVFLVLSILSAMIGFLKTKYEGKIIISFFVFNLVFSFLIFIRTQTPGYHHSLPFYLWMLLILLYGVCYLKNRILYFSLCILVIFSYFNTFFNLPNVNLGYFSPEKRMPLHIGNYQSYQDLNRTILELVSRDLKSGENSKVAVYGSSPTLTNEVLHSLSNDEMKKYIIRVGDVDLRDLITLDGLMAKYVITSTPIQTHLPKSGQQTVIIPASSILNSKNIGKAYRKLDYEFKLNDKVTAYIYEKYRGFTLEELNEFFSEFYKSYPEWRTKYNDKLVRAYLTAYPKLGDGYAVFRYVNGEFLSHPGNNTPTILKWNKLDFSTLTIKSTNLSCRTKDPVDITLSDNERSLTYSLQKGESKSLSLTDYNHGPIKLVIDKSGTSFCDSVDIILN